MNGYKDQAYVQTHEFAPEERPDFYELQDHAEASMVKRGLARYFFTRNYERSIKMHSKLGTPLVRKVVMGTVGRLLSRPGMGGNYRLDHSRSRIEAATKFAVNGSIFNEAVHTTGFTFASIGMAINISEARYGTGFLANAAGTGINLGLVALQRYNRARMIKHVDKGLSEGESFSSNYKTGLV